ARQANVGHSRVKPSVDFIKLVATISAAIAPIRYTYATTTPPLVRSYKYDRTRTTRFPHIPFPTADGTPLSLRPWAAKAVGGKGRGRQRPAGGKAGGGKAGGGAS